MNRNQSGTRQQPFAFHGVELREIGLRAVAAAILYQGGTAERTFDRELSASPASAKPSSGHET
jgi:hypothetical protein